MNSSTRSGTGKSIMSVSRQLSTNSITATEISVRNCCIRFGTSHVRNSRSSSVSLVTRCISSPALRRVSPESVSDCTFP